MSTLANKDLVHRFYDLYNADRAMEVEQLLARGFVDHNPAPGQAPDKPGLRDLLLAYRVAFPDSFIALEDMLAERDEVAVRYTLHGTHLGEFLGLRPTDRRVAMTGIDIWRVAGSGLVERWGNRDDLGLREQIGALPTPAAEAANS